MVLWMLLKVTKPLQIVSPGSGKQQEGESGKGSLGPEFEHSLPQKAQADAHFQETSKCQVPSLFKEQSRLHVVWLVDTILSVTGD